MMVINGGRVNVSIAIIAAPPESDFIDAALEYTVFDASPSRLPITGIKFPLAKRADLSANVSLPEANIVWNESRKFIVEKRNTRSVVIVFRMRLQRERRSTLDGSAPESITAKQMRYIEKKNEPFIPCRRVRYISIPFVEDAAAKVFPPIQYNVAITGRYDETKSVNESSDTSTSSITPPRSE